jgi:DNA-directed RNA polymerase specialized sigma24 family protein
METLTAEERAAISLFYFDDYDGRTAAEMLGKTYSHFRIILYRARNKLKGALQS